MKTKFVKYTHDNVQLEGILMHLDEESRPGILIAPDWNGRKPEYLDIANRLTAQGYHTFILDMFGNGLRETCKEKKLRLILPFLEHRDLLQARMLCALQAFCEFEFVKRDKLAVIGYCFGGMCALDLARMGGDVTGVVSVHGLLTPANNISHPNITANILAIHGNKDRVVTERDLREFAKEMDQANANWELQIFGNAMHAFTSPESNDPNFGAIYDPDIAENAMRNIEFFLEEIFQSHAAV